MTIHQIYPAQTIIRKPPVNLLNEHTALYTAGASIDFPPSEVVELINVILYRNKLIYNGKIISNEHSATPLSALQLEQVLNVPTSIIVKKAIWSFGCYGAEYFHWLTETLPRTLLSKPYIDEHHVLLPMDQKIKRYLEPTLKLLELTPFYYPAIRPVLIENLLFCTSPPKLSHYRNQHVQAFSDFFKSTLSSNPPFRKLYISRKKAHHRRVINEEEVRQIVQDLGFEVHVMEDYSFAEQIYLTSEAKYLAGVHGAGMGNMLFMPSGGYIYEIRNEEDAKNKCLYFLTCAMEHSYFYQFDKGIGSQPITADVWVNTDTLAQNLAQMLTMGG